MMLTWGFFCVLLTLAAARNKAPLLDDGTRTRNKAAECVFGKQVRELGSQWIPDLGVPIGVLYCMKCECVPLQKKRRIVARVQCRSIKNECPEPTCDEPVHRPGRCCKTCPGDMYDSDIIQDIVPQNVLDEEEKSSTKHYAALLTERSSLVLRNDFRLMSNNLNKNNVVATGRFTFHKKNLYYSFYISDKAARPRSLQFVDNEGNILEEFVLSRSGGLVNSLYQNATRKVCGVWKRIPHEYRKRFRQEKIYVALVWGVKDQAEFTLSGQVMKYTALATENFSSLLEPAVGTMTGAGGTAIVSISTSVSTSIYLAIVFNGLFTEEDIADVPINVTLSLDEKKYILQEVVRVKKPHYELNMVEVRSPVTPADLRLLTRGRLVLTVSSVSKPEALRLSGSVVTKVTCELFQTTLSSSSDTNRFGTSGLAWLYLNNEGSLVYNVQIDNLKTTPDNTTFITLVDVSTKRRTELEDLTPTFDFINGWANGTLAKLSPKVLEPLYSGNLAVNVATPNDTSLVRGRLVAKPVADARDAPAPFLLKRENYTLPASAVGIAWLYVDNDCCIHYDVSISGLGSDRKLELYLELLPMLAPGAPVITRYLDEFQGNQVEGSPVNSLNREEIKRLDNGVGFLKIKEKDTKITLLVATVRHVMAPSTCQPQNPDNDVHSIVDDSDVGPSGDCFYENKFYQQEAQWTSSDNPCTTCFCENGNNKCFTMECPEVKCPDDMKLEKVPGECCAICVNSTSLVESNRNVPQKCIFNGQAYSPGSKFHPFLIPTGFDSCTVCTCDAKYLEIKCKRIYNEKQCCKNCARVDYSMNGTYSADDEVPMLLHGVVPRKEIPAKSAEQILAEGGCPNLYDARKPYVNGSEYHPSIVSLGEYKCVTCKCENGKPTCWRECDKATCEKLFRMKKKQRTEAGMRWNNSQCCTLRMCRKYRHKKGHRLQKS
ncbi:dorsal-ventral patterning protein Sog isoform X1 [Tribolium madens]|uniref:dorsal-ventral patterning protein Sog isoform X1 n=2 Tax=Tribolium madens TaxID=41895 RepID=UPI001CF75319|nr:dorsal-ventral patterning protein Sog isoform X1 [Tribolium madens]